MKKYHFDFLLSIDKPGFLYEILGISPHCSHQDVLILANTIDFDSKEFDHQWQKKIAFLALQDEFYFHTYRNNPSIEYLFEAGWFADARKSQQLDYLIDLPSTACLKIKNNLFHNKTKLEKPVVLICTGSFCPPHLGHLNMMQEAKNHLQSIGYDVIGGYFSASHDNYVFEKQKDRQPLHHLQRNFLIQTMLANDNWLDADPWESTYVDFSINFTDVIKRTKLYLENIFKQEIIIGYVFGSDNAAFSRAFTQTSDFLSICVQRENNKFQDIQQEIIFHDNAHFVECEEKWQHYSSTQAQKNPTDHLSDKILNQYNDYIENLTIASNSKETYAYVVRNDLDFGCSHLSFPYLQEAKINFLNDLTQLLDETFKISKENINIKVCTVDANEQQTILNQLPDDQVINLDIITNSKYKISFSRLFEQSGFQNNYVSIVSRNDKTLKEQIDLIPTGKYIFVDDDIASGSTVKFVKNLLASNEIEIVQEISLAQESLTDDVYHQIYDIVDARDFLFVAKESGLVVENFSNEIVRVPYVLPFVNLSTRAKLPFDSQEYFCKKLIEINDKFCQKIGITYNFSSAMKATINFWNKKIA